MKNINKILDKTVGNINTSYDLTIEEVIQLLNLSIDNLDLVSKVFDIGYYQGVKAQKNGKPWTNKKTIAHK